MLSFHQVQQKLQNERPQLDLLKIKHIYIFGSVARGDNTSISDVDVLIDFSEQIGLFHFLKVKSYLEQLFHVSIDLVTREALRPELKDQILSEARFAA